jgi:3-dehydroquinate synthase
MTVDPVRRVVQVDLGPRSYPIAITTGLDDITHQLTSRLATRRALVVADSNVAPRTRSVMERLADAGWRAEAEVLPPGEGTKSVPALAQLYSALARLPADRHTAVIAIGGGVIGDLAGFAAATFNRGIPLVMLPTTLLAMVDSSVSGKTGINLPEGKNLVGSFHQPALVYIDLGALESLPGREYRSGLAEVVKYGVILDPGLFDFVESHARDLLDRNEAAVSRVVARSCELKAEVVRQDEREETGMRAILNYGHTFAHAFETVLGYGAWLHGEAVSAGMVCAGRLARRLGWVDDAFCARQEKLLEALRLPVSPPEAPADELLAVMRRDKKNRDGRTRFILPRRMGEVVLHEGVPESEVRAVLAG